MTLGEQANQPGVGGVPHDMRSGAQLVGLLAHPAFRGLESDISRVRLRSGETLFKAGEPGDSLYVVVFGRLRALIRGERGDHVLGEVGRGESVGEMALLTGEPRSATVCAIRDSELIRLSTKAFELMIERQPQVMLAMARLIVARYQRVIRPAEEMQPVALAVVPCSADVPVADFADGLVRALSPGRKVLSLDATTLQRQRGASDERSPPDVDSAELAGWLQDQERKHDYLVYTADPSASLWTRLCVRQADVVLFVGASGGAGRIEPSLLDLVKPDATTAARRELVLLYDSGRGMPRGTAEWLARIPVTAHHHLDPRLTRDYERLARMLTGRAIGLVLGGGGARGLAHIGIIRALEEAGIPIDLVGGTSVGALVGGQCASGWDSARIQAESHRRLVEDGSLNDFTLPIMALLHGRRFFTMLGKLFEDRCIEDLPRTYFCVSTNLTRSTCMVHTAGPIQKWVGASMAVPGLGPPIFAGRDILVDGGVVNNLPIDIMRGLRRGPVFASSVSPRDEMRLDREYTDILSPWRVLLSWLNPFGTPMQVPRIGSILMRTVSLQQLKSGVNSDEDADLLFEPPHEGHKLLDWQAFDKIVDLGYRTGRAAIERWQSTPSGTAGAEFKASAP